jgi:hypothetical protein
MQTPKKVATVRKTVAKVRTMLSPKTFLPSLSLASAFFVIETSSVETESLRSIKSLARMRNSNTLESFQSWLGVSWSSFMSLGIEAFFNSSSSSAMISPKFGLEGVQK